MVTDSGHRAYAYSPQMSADVSSNASGSRQPSYHQFFVRGKQDPAIQSSFARNTPGMPSNAFVGGDDPFMGPTPSSAYRWRSQMRSTDESMPDCPLSEPARSKSGTEMSGVDWPRRDIQKHIDEAAIDEIIRALSPSKKDQLLSALSPGKSSDNAGLMPPSNTPLTAEASKQPMPEVDPTEKNTPIKHPVDVIAGRAESIQGIRLGTAENTSRPRTRSNTSSSVLAVLEQGIIRRSTRSKSSTTIKNVAENVDLNRERSSSRSSKRKRSTSPMTQSKAAQKTGPKSSPHENDSDGKENISITDDDSIEAGVSIQG